MYWLFFSIIYLLHPKEATEGLQRCMVSQTMRNDSPEEVKKRAMADPEVQQIMSDPAMRMILEQMQKDPQALSEYVWFSLLSLLASLCMLPGFCS